MHTLLLKPCTPEDVNDAVPLIYSSGPEAFDFVFKNRKYSAQDFLRFAFKRKGGEFSYENHYALWKGGEIVGIGAVFFHEKSKSFIFNDLANILSFYGLEGIPITFNGLRVETLLKLPKKKEKAIVHLGVKEPIRGRGLGTKLIDMLIQKTRSEEQEKFVLDVSEENPKAKALYERLGFVIEKKYYSQLKNRYSYLPNHYRMGLAS